MHFAFAHVPQYPPRRPVDRQCLRHTLSRRGQPWSSTATADAFHNKSHNSKYITYKLLVVIINCCKFISMDCHSCGTLIYNVPFASYMYAKNICSNPSHDRTKS